MSNQTSPGTTRDISTYHVKEKSENACQILRWTVSKRIYIFQWFSTIVKALKNRKINIKKKELSEICFGPQTLTYGMFAAPWVTRVQFESSKKEPIIFSFIKRVAPLLRYFIPPINICLSLKNCMLEKHPLKFYRFGRSVEPVEPELMTSLMN